MLARREHGASELRGKLIQRGCEPRLAEAVVQDLSGSGSVSDGRFVEAFVAARRGRGYGPVRIRRELELRGVPEEEIDAGLNIREAGWDELARTVRARRFGPAVPRDFPIRARQMRFLQQRGFSSDQIARAFDDV
jgi:regulatory protein